MKLLQHRFDAAFLSAWLLIFFADRIIPFLGVKPIVLMAVAVALLFYAAVGLVPQVWLKVRNLFGSRD
jgi:hypothetical protein